MISDEKGMFLLVTPAGSKWWRLKYRFAGKEKLLSQGVYPEIGVRDARDRRDAARKLLLNGIDPSIDRQVQKAASTERSENSSERVAREWFSKFSPKCAPWWSSSSVRKPCFDRRHVPHGRWSRGEVRTKVPCDRVDAEGATQPEVTWLTSRAATA